MDLTRGRWAVAMVLALLALPTVQAAQSEVSIETPETELIDPGGSDRVPLKIVYTYHGEGTSSGRVDVHLTLDDTSLVTASVDPSTVTIDVDDQQRRGVGHTNLTVGMASDAMAFEQEEISIEARAESSGNVDGSTGTNAYAAQAAFSGNLSLAFESDTITVSEGQYTTATLVIDNEANGRAQGNVDIVAKPDGTQVGFSPTDGIDVSATGEARQRLDVAIVKIGSGSAAGQVQLQAAFHPYGVQEPALTSNVATIQVEEGLGLPGPGLLAAAAALAGTAWAIRRD